MKIHATMSEMLARKFLNLVLVATIALFGAGSAFAQTAQQIAKKAFDSTVLLVMEDANGQPLSLGSGFFVGEGQIASNFHVIEGAARGYAKLIDSDTKYDIDGILVVDTKRDLVILKVSAKSPPLSFGDSSAVQIGDPVYAVGNPQGLEGTFSQGIVSSVRDIEGDSLLQITAPISPGSSGGPVLNGKGEVIGVSVATFRGGQNLNFAIPTSYLTALRSQIQPTTKAEPLAAIKTDKNRDSILANWQGQEDNSVVGGKFAWTATYSDINDGRYSFSIHNKLRTNIYSVKCYVIFYDNSGDQVDTDYVEYEGLIPAGLTRRIDEKIAESTAKFIDKRTPLEASLHRGRTYKDGRVTIRILDFQLAK